MSDETAPDVLDDRRTGSRRSLRLDLSVNVGHILTMLAMLTAAATAWASLDKRLVVLEEAKVYQASRDAAQDARINEKFEAIKESQRDQVNALERLRGELRSDRPFGQPTPRSRP